MTNCCFNWKKLLPIMSYNCNFKQSTISSMPMQ